MSLCSKDNADTDRKGLDLINSLSKVADTNQHIKKSVFGCWYQWQTSWGKTYENYPSTTNLNYCNEKLEMLTNKLRKHLNYGTSFHASRLAEQLCESILHHPKQPKNSMKSQNFKYHCPKIQEKHS